MNFKVPGFLVLLTIWFAFGQNRSFDVYNLGEQLRKSTSEISFNVRSATAINPDSIALYYSPHS
ncbi:MAG: hypothetical protein EOM06_15430, partial [Sphingobacteriia bacterium]|nr:hypothetical protein [Sphingobacteriia bacterium]